MADDDDLLWDELLVVEEERRTTRETCVAIGIGGDTREMCACVERMVGGA